MQALPCLLIRLSLARLLAIPLLLSSPLAYPSLTASTANTIKGKQPYLTFDSGVTQVTTTDSLLQITLPDGTTITTLTDTSSENTPIILPSISDTFANIDTLVPLPSAGNTTYPSTNLDDIIKMNNYWGDDDGDNNVTVTGSLTVKWADVSGADITDTVKSNPNMLMNICDAPYTLTVATTAGSLSTQYGDPSSSPLDNNSHSYYINPQPPTTPYVCFAKPLLAFNYGEQPEWNGTKGFRVQDINTPTLNFPTTGFDQAFFDLTVFGAPASSVTAIPRSASSNVNLALTVNPEGAGEDVVRITLNGPSHAAQNSFEPVVFELFANSTKIYSFELSKWYIARPGFVQYNTKNDWTGTASTPLYCTNLTGNYRVPEVREYTNANARYWTTTVPNWRANTYARQIGGGVMAEWGQMSSYSGSGFTNNYYWVIEARPTTQHYVKAYDGAINGTFPHGSDGKAACVSP